MNNRGLLSLLTAAHGVNHMTIGMMSVSLPIITKELAFTFTQIGIMKGIQAVVAGLSSAAGGIATDLLRRRRALMIVAIGWTAVFLFFNALASSFFSFTLFLALQLLLGGFLWHPPAMATIADHYPGQKGFALAVHEAGGNIGHGIAPFLTGLLLGFISWRHVFQGYVLPCAITVAFLWYLLPTEEQLSSQKKSITGFGKTFREGILKSPAFIALTFVSGMRGAGEQATQTFLPLYFSYHLGMSPVWIGVTLSVMTLGATLTGPFVGHLSDRFSRKRVISLCMLNGGLLLIILSTLNSIAVVIPVASLTGLCLFSLRSLLIAFGTDIAPPSLGGTSVGFIYSFDRIFAALNPLFAGYLADRFGLQSAILFLALCILTGGLAIHLIPDKKTVKGCEAPKEAISSLTE
jgi:FSR family fosmidomycin resistance protein-like MFS transporter